MEGSVPSDMNVRLRRVTEADLEKIMNWRMKPSVTENMYSDPVLTLEGQKKWFRRISESETDMIWVFVCDDTDVGVFSLNEIDRHNKRCSLGCYIGEESYRGKGIFRRIELNAYDYVFQTLGFNRFIASALSENETAIRVYKKCGCQIEGVFKEHIYKNGIFHDVVMMAITADRWQEIKKDFEYEIVEFEESE
jgi:UDP-4-amino-4,6-dideoxy-N-acetyl-beta-L-altrosamine N-acetyltransferase